MWRALAAVDFEPVLIIRCTAPKDRVVDMSAFGLWYREEYMVRAIEVALDSPSRNDEVLKGVLPDGFSPRRPLRVAPMADAPEEMRAALEVARTAPKSWRHFGPEPVSAKPDPGPAIDGQVAEAHTGIGQFQ